MNLKHSYIIISYHSDKKKLHKQLSKLSMREAIIVDNGQTLTQADVGEATLLSQSQNLGYGAAANIGMRHALAYGAEWVVILNQDTVFTRAAVEDLQKQLGKLEPCIAGPAAGGLDFKRWTTVLPSKKAQYITGSCIAVHQKVIKKIGYFYEPYFLYYEEADYCIRAKRAGFMLRALPIEGITHEESVSLGRGSAAHQYYLARNHLLFVSRMAPIRVRTYERFRFPLTISEHIIRCEWGALSGIGDFVLRRFGPRKGGA